MIFGASNGAVAATAAAAVETGASVASASKIGGVAESGHKELYRARNFITRGKMPSRGHRCTPRASIAAGIVHVDGLPGLDLVQMDVDGQSIKAADERVQSLTIFAFPSFRAGQRPNRQV